jgi:hypothetical protein
MAYQSTFDHPARDTNAFYRRTLHVLSDARIPFMVGGSHAILHYTGIVRETKDFDLFIRRDDLDAALQALREAGYHTEITFPHWLAKARQGNDVVDLVFSSGNGVCRVDDAWFSHAIEADVLGMPVKIAPVEELLWQKAYVMERERYDGADVAHILRACAESLDWERVVRRFDPHWQLLLSYLVMFGFIYPSERHRIPARVMTDLVNRLVLVQSVTWRFFKPHDCSNYGMNFVLLFCSLAGLRLCERMCVCVCLSWFCGVVCIACIECCAMF